MIITKLYSKDYAILELMVEDYWNANPAGYDTRLVRLCTTTMTQHLTTPPFILRDLQSSTWKCVHNIIVPPCQDRGRGMDEAYEECLHCGEQRHCCSHWVAVVAALSPNNRKVYQCATPSLSCDGQRVSLHVWQDEGEGLR